MRRVGYPGMLEMGTVGTHRVRLLKPNHTRGVCAIPVDPSQVTPLVVTRTQC
jgi:hypothetical protein